MLAAAEPRRLRRWIRRKRLVLQDDDTASPCHHMRRRLVVDNPKGSAGAPFLGLEIPRIDTIFMVSFLRVVREGDLGGVCVCATRFAAERWNKCLIRHDSLSLVPVIEQLFLKWDTRESP